VFLFAILLVAAIVVFARVAGLDSAAEISREDFLQCVSELDEPAVIVVHHYVLWLVGAARNRYICSFRGLRIHTRSFKPLTLPPEAAVIRTWKL
jgi:hypothetical protein